MEYYTVNVDNEFNLDWSTYKWFESKDELKSIEEQFNLDLDQDGEIFSANQLSNTLQDVVTDSAGRKLRIDSEEGLWIKDGDNTFAITYPDGSIYSADITQEDNQSGYTYSSKAAVQKSGDNYKLVVKETITTKRLTTYSDNSTFTDVNYIIYRISESRSARPWQC